MNRFLLQTSLGDNPGLVCFNILGFAVRKCVATTFVGDDSY